MVDQPPLLRCARPDEAAAITDLALRSKRLWGYSDEFMALITPVMTLTAEDIAADFVEVLEADARLVGYLRLKRRPDEAWLEDLFIDPDLVGQGHGRRLFNRAADVSRGWNHAVMSFESDPNALSFYLALGAEQVGAHPSPFPPGRETPLLNYRL
jgi:GNAT superfamily N-acetyltransferase